MNQYLLLRDNKQTGPYTVEELAAKGLKAYDLVWLEGKSAAWRYPSEIAELKPFAPVVEEQPYDRFYKKTEEDSHPALDQARKAAMAEAKREKASAFKKVEEPAYAKASADEPAITPAKAEEEEINAYQEPEKEAEPQPGVHPKKIYVTLPGNSSRREAKKAAASFSQSINTIAEERPLVKQQEVAPVVSINESFEHNTTDKDLYTQLQENELSKPKKRQRNMRPVMLGLVAACILLFGVIIGLYISNMKQQTQNQALEDMVKRIQDRDKNHNTNTPATPPQQIVNEMQQAIDSTNANKQESDPKLHISTVARKGNPPPDLKPQPVNAVTDIDESDAPIVQNASVEEDAAKEKITYQQAAIEAARKNIHQQLLVENSKFRTGVLGGISNLHMTISNNSRFPLDQVEIEIKYYGPEQRLVKTQTLLFNDLAPGEQKTLEAPRTSRGVTIDYAITRIQSKVLGLAQHRF
jgi:hypothetical protein